MGSSGPSLVWGGGVILGSQLVMLWCVLTGAMTRVGSKIYPGSNSKAHRQLGQMSSVEKPFFPRLSAGGRSFSGEGLLSLSRIDGLGLHVNKQTSR